MKHKWWWITGSVAALVLLVGLSFVFAFMFLNSPLSRPRPVPQEAASAMLGLAAADLGVAADDIRVIRGVVNKGCVTSTFVHESGEAKTVAVLEDGSWDVRLTSLTVDRDALPSAGDCRRLWESSS